MYIEQLGEKVPPPSQTTVRISNHITLLILCYISSGLVIFIKFIDAPIQVSDILGLSVSFKFIKFSFSRPEQKFTINVKVKWSCYRPGVVQRVGGGIALLFHDRGTRRGWVVSSTPRPHFTPGKDPVPTLQKAGWAPGPVWTGGKSCPHRDSIPVRPAPSQSLYQLSYRAH